jgi:HTH-type transcriptional regulator, competence development regulator
MQHTFGQNIKDFRIRHTDYSLRKLAELTKISPTYLSRIENDKESPPSEDIIIRIAKALGMNEDELLSTANKISPDVQHTIRSNPEFLPSFIRTVSSLDGAVLEEIIELINFMSAKQPTKKLWRYIEKIIKGLLDERIAEQDLQAILSFVNSRMQR